MNNNIYPISKKEAILSFIFTILFWGCLAALIYFVMFKMVIGESLPSKDLNFILLMIYLPFVFFIGLTVFIKTIYRLLYLNSLEYSLESKNLTFKGGVIAKFDRTIPYSKIQHVIIYQSFLQSLLGLASVSIETARETGFSPNNNRSQIISGPFIPDLNKESATALKDKIVSLFDSKSVAGI